MAWGDGSYLFTVLPCVVPPLLISAGFTSVEIVTLGGLTDYTWRVRCVTRSLLQCATSTRHRFYALGVLRWVLHAMSSTSPDGPHLMIDPRCCNGRTTFPTLSGRQLYTSISRT